MNSKNIVIVDIEIKEIIPSFVTNRQKDLKDLKDLIQNREFLKIKVIGHKMSGNAPSYGFTLLGEIGFNMENSAEKENLEEIKVEYEKFVNFMNNYEIKYE